MKKYLRVHVFLFVAFLLALTAITALAPSANAWAEEDPIYTSYFSSDAAGGYDVVAYFTEARPVEGNKAFKTKYKDANWLFASQENLDKFAANPEMYAPQYGGYCAWAVAKGTTASGDPLLWTVHNDKLYLNYNQDVNNRWRADMDKLIISGDENWPTVLN